MKIKDFLIGVAAGATVMYFLDPENGSYRRSVARLPNPLADRMLADRVRSQIIHTVKHPSAIDVHVRNGSVVLSGPVPTEELERVIQGVAGIRGVTEVENHLEAHDEPGEPTI